MRRTEIGDSSCQWKVVRSERSEFSGFAPHRWEYQCDVLRYDFGFWPNTFQKMAIFLVSWDLFSLHCRCFECAIKLTSPFLILQRNSVVCTARMRIPYPSLLTGPGIRLAKLKLSGWRRVLWWLGLKIGIQWVCTQMRISMRRTVTDEIP